MTHGLLMSDGNFTTIDFPGATMTVAYASNRVATLRDGIRTLLGNPWLSVERGQFISFDFPNATFTGAAAINPGDMVGRYTLAGVNHGFLLVGMRPDA